MKNIDVLITASSRPQCLPRAVESFKEKVDFDGSFRFLIHEDFVFPEHSKRTMKWIEESGVFNIITYDERPIGLGETLHRMIPLVNTPYMFYLQDDWEFERRIPLTDIIGIFENYEDINQIFFNKYRTYAIVGGFYREEREVHPIRSNAKYVLSLNNGWQLLPGVWRMSWMKNRYRIFGSRKERPEGNFTNKLGHARRRQDAAFCKKAIGSYVWGPQHDYRYVLHLGDELRMAHWRLEGGKPGGNIPPKEAYDDKHKAPWVPDPVRPTRDEY